MQIILNTSSLLGCITLLLLFKTFVFGEIYNNEFHTGGEKVARNTDIIGQVGTLNRKTRTTEDERSLSISSDYYSYDYYSETCHEQCYDQAGCSGVNADDCYKCKMYRDRETDECVSQCPGGQFPPPESHQRCRNCNAKCKTCFGHAINNCLSCPDEYYLREDSAKCVEKCDENGFFPDENRVCRFCDLTCYTCATSADFCTSCPIGLYKNTRNRCVEFCDDNEYVSDDMSCQPCDDACFTCDGPGVGGCISCRDSYVIKEDVCIHREDCSAGFYINEDDECLRCHPACAECNGKEDHDCTKCLEHYVLVDNHCSQSCGDQKYVNDEGNCGDCQRSCKTCVSNTTCIECVDNWVLVSGECQVGCPSGMYEMDHACYDCHGTCSECTGGDPHDCIQCNPGDRFLYKHKCLLACPDGYFPDQTYPFNPQCTICDETCFTCVGDSYRDCLTCMDGLVKNKDSICTEQSFVRCPDNCNCDGGSSFQCSECNDGFYLYNRECLAECPLRFVALSTPKVCGACHPSCESCSGISHHECTTCISDYYLTPDDTCEPDCFWFDKTYQDQSREQWTCSPCHSRCALCFGPQADDCIVCADGRYLLALEDVAGLVKHKCVEANECGIESYADETTNECIPCYPTCKGCKGPDATDCLHCTASFVKDLNGICQSVCNIGQFESDGCKDCHTSCLTCTGTESVDCLTCDFTRYLMPDTRECLEHCGDMYYPDFQDNICKPCFPTCMTCASYEESECLTCKEDYYIHMGRYCRVQCPRGYYEYNIGELTCRQCSVECADCMGNYLNCTKCDNSEYLHKGRCLGQCPTGYEGKLGHCVASEAQQNGYLCPPFCDECTDGFCTKCDDGYTIYFGGCLNMTSDCEKNEYFNGDSCKACDVSCSTCLGPTSSDCLQCPDGMFLESGACVQNCPDGSYSNGNECGDCHPTCKTCNGPSQYDCIDCEQDMFISFDHSCHNECPPGFYYTETKECEICEASCKTCSQDANNCLACPRETYLYGSMCVDSCPIERGYYHFVPEETNFVSSTNECRLCDNSCLACFGGGNNQCTKCKANLFLKDNECLVNCGTFFYEDLASKTCKHCHGNCESCSGKSDMDCLTCQGSKYLVSHECLDEQPAHYYCRTTPYGNECNTCHASCLTCDGGGVFDCLTCHPGHVLDYGICYPRCTNGTYFQASNSSAGDDCGQCVKPCLDCYGPNPNQCITCVKGKKMHHINKTHHYCVTCCEEGKPTVEGQCCECNEKTKHCRPGLRVKDDTSKGTHKNNNRTSSTSTHATAIILSCLAIIVLFFAIFGVLQARSNRSLCFSAYERLPTYYNGSKVQVVLAKEPRMPNKQEYMSPDDEDTDEYPSDDDDENEEIY